jgi:protein TonB
MIGFLREAEMSAPSSSDRARARRRQRVFAVFLAASAALHAALMIAVRLPASSPEPTRLAAIEVSLRSEREPPRTVPQAPPPQARPARAPERAAPAPRPAQSERDPGSPGLAAVSQEQPAPAPPETAEPAPGQSLAAPTEAHPPVLPASVSPPRLDAAYLRNPAPPYPLAARRAGEQGTVLLRVLVARDGAPARVELEKSSGSPHLDSAALEAVRAWRFVPARRGAEPIESWVLVPIVFRLEG